jgi:tyrosine-specific transport protein
MDDGQKPPLGRVFGAILLIAGCCVGAGMLGVPVVSALAGFLPSIVMFFVGWIFMVSTGLLLLEANLWFPREINIITLSDQLLGRVGRIVAWVGFLFIFYALNIAYISGSGELLADYLSRATSYELPPWMCNILSTLFLGVILYFGIVAADRFNRLFMLGLVICYGMFVYFGAPYVNQEYLQYENWDYAPVILPLVIISLGYHNLIPSLTTYLNRDAKSLRLSVIIGSSIPLAIYLLWEWLILGLVPSEGTDGLQAGVNQGQIATHILQEATGNYWVASVAQAFAFFAIATSFISVSLSFVDFLADGLNIRKIGKGKVILCLLVLMPPLFFAIVYPQIFLSALGYAGGYGTVVLFGLLPAAMAWEGRYRQKLQGPRLLPGGKLSVILIVIFSVMVMGIQLFMGI